MIVRGSQFFMMIAGISMVLLSCSDGKKNDPGILTPDQMVQSLSDLYIAEQRVSRLNLTTDSSLIVFGRMRGKIFKQKSINDSIFKKSYEYYMDRPVELEQIYTAVIDSLSLQEQRMDLAASQPKKK